MQPSAALIAQFFWTRLYILGLEVFYLELTTQAISMSHAHKVLTWQPNSICGLVQGNGPKRST